MPSLVHGHLYIGKPLIVFYGDRHTPNSGAYDEDGEYFRTDLTVTAVLKDSAAATVSGSSITLSLKTTLHGPGTDAVYEGTLPATITLTENGTYYLEITAKDSGNTTLDFVRIEYIAEYNVGS